MNKSLILALTLIVFASFGYAGTRNRWMVPVNQTGATDTYALPCSPVTINVAQNTAVTPVLALSEAGMVYWAAIVPATAGDYLVFRDSATANTSSTALATFEAPTITDTKFIQFDPPIAVANGLSINVSSQTTSAVVCVRYADGDL